MFYAITIYRLKDLSRLMAGWDGWCVCVCVRENNGDTYNQYDLIMIMMMKTIA